MDQIINTLTDSLLIVLTVISVAGVAASLLWLFIVSGNKNTLGIAYLIVAFLLEVVLVTQPSIQLGLQIYPTDVISLLVFTSIIFRFLQKPLPLSEAPFLLWLAYGITILMSFSFGLIQNGKAAGTELRPFFYTWVAGLYCCTAEFDEAEIRRLARWCVWTSYALIGIAIYFWVGVESGFIPRYEVFDAAAATKEFRPVGAGAAFFIGAVGLGHFLTWIRGTGTRWSGWHAFICTVAVIILQHRSVWFAFGVGLVYLMVQERRHLPRRAPLLVGFMLTVSILIGIAQAFGLFGDLFERLAQSTLSISDPEGTFAAREDSWGRLFEEWHGSSVRTILFGFPFGHGYTRLYHGQLITFGAHNTLLSQLLRVGVIGAALFVLATLIPMIYSMSTKTESEFEYLLMRTLGAVLLATVVYCIPYNAFYLQGAVLGLALAQMIRHRRARARRFHNQRAPLHYFSK